MRHVHPPRPPTDGTSHFMLTRVCPEIVLKKKKKRSLTPPFSNAAPFRQFLVKLGAQHSAERVCTVRIPQNQSEI